MRFLALLVVSLFANTASIFASSSAVWEKNGSRCVPNFSNSTTYVGYICLSVGPSYEKLGLVAKENIVAINGTILTKVKKLDGAIDLWEEFDSSPHGTLEVERNGKKIILKK